MITIRPLNFKQPEDLAQFKTLYASWLQTYGVTLTDQRFWGFIAFYKYESKFVGAFEDNNLVAVMRYYQSNIVPYYYLNSLILDQDKYTYSEYFPDHPFVKILDNILETMELEGRYTWFQSYFFHENNIENPNDLIKHCGRGWDDKKQQLRYDRYVEEYIPKNSRSKNSSFEMLIFNKIWPVDMNIVHSSLKPEYRQIGDAISEEYKFFI
jgi:hypothetical protein